MDTKKVKTGLWKDAKGEMEKRRKAADAASKPQTMKQIREQTGPTGIQFTMKKDKDGTMRRVKEKVVLGDPKLKQIGVIRRQQIKPLTEQEMARIKQAAVRQNQMLIDQAALYQDQLKAQKFLAGIRRGKVSAFPKKGFSTYKIEAAYRKRRPPWRLKIRINRRTGEVHMKMVATRDYLQGAEKANAEVLRILTLMDFQMTPGSYIRNVVPPKVGQKFVWIHIAVKAQRRGEGEIRPR